MHTTMMRASMTAYSTAVGPSSFRQKLTTKRWRFWSIVVSLSWLALRLKTKRSFRATTVSPAHWRGCYLLNFRGGHQSSVEPDRSPAGSGDNLTHCGLLGTITDKTLTVKISGG